MRESVELVRRRVFQSLFQDYDGPPFCVRLWDGWYWLSSPGMESASTIVIHSARALRVLVGRPSEITLAEQFISNEIDVEGDIFSVFDVAEHVFRCPQGQRQRILDLISGAFFRMDGWCRSGKRHFPKRDRTAISYHYDKPAEFFRSWLGESLVYSCAYFRTFSDSIDVAQFNKLDLICRKLRLQPCERFLDIGCGWGSLLLHAASHHGVYANGITLSREQAAVAAARIEQARLTQSCDVQLLDYRDAGDKLSTFDKIASVGMFEHVGLKNLPLYFTTAYRLLRPGGVFLNHGIARCHLSQSCNHSLLDRFVLPYLRNSLLFQGARNSSFIDKYVFPDGELVTLSQAIRAAESVGFEVRDVENLREHYELTLRSWVDALRRNADSLLKEVSQRTFRIWLLYMAGSAAAFRRGDIAVYQVLLSRPDRGRCHLPLTRQDWYSSSLSTEGVQV